MPGTYAFPAIQRGDTKTLVVLLRRKGLLTQQKEPLPLEGATIDWRLSPPGKDPIVFTDTDGLIVDRPTSQVGLPLSVALSNSLPASVPYRLRVTDSDGVVTTYLTGTLTFQG
jgi:hypothetical protein